MSDYRRLLSAVRPHLGLLATAIAAMVVLSAATGAFSWLLGPMLQFVFKGGVLDAHSLRSALPYVQFTFPAFVGDRLVADLRRQIFHQVQR